jgi:hypothetical protein
MYFLEIKFQLYNEKMIYSQLTTLALKIKDII